MADTNITRVSLPYYLQDLAIGFKPYGLIADIVSPRTDVYQITGKYRVFGKNSMIPQRSERAPGTLPNAVEWFWSSGSYYVTERALRQLLTDEEVAANQSAQLGGIVDLSGRITQHVTNKVAIAREQRIATQFTTAANYPGANVITKAGGSEWDTLAVSAPTTPFTDLTNLISVVAANAMVPKQMLTVIIPQQVFDLAIMNNSSFIARVQYTAITSITPAILANLLQVKQVLIAQTLTVPAGLEIAGADPVTGYVATYLWKDFVWAGVVDESTNDMVPSFARTLQFRALTGGAPRQVRQYRAADEGQRADWIEVAEALDEVITFSGAGGLIVNTLSTV